jgi:hypothetical protein
MIPNRIPEEFFSMTSRIAPPVPAGFLMIPVAPASCQPQSPLQNLYQQLYDQAVAVAQTPAMRDLFVVMN